ncbi:MAG: PQQ-binding-like beta-propeller repeat protein [Pirellulaceae bacterium]
MRSLLRSSCSMVALTCVSTIACAEDWPEFRGPTNQGIVASAELAAELPRQWSAQENIDWRTELPGQGWSSPIVVGNSIILTAAIPTDQTVDTDKPVYELTALFLNARSGSIAKRIPLFVEEASAPKIHQKNSHASPTPVFDGQHVYVHFGHQGTACISPAGEVLWRNETLAYPPVHGNGGSPAVVDDLLIFSRDGANIAEVTALDKLTGKVRWQTTRDVEAKKQFSFCTPLLINAGDRRQLILPGSNVVQSLDPANGQEIWRVTYDGYSVIPRPIFEAGLVFICTGYDRPSLLAIDPTGVGDVTETHVKWREGSGIAHTPSLIGENGRITTVSDNGIATSFDALTGKQLWKERIGGNFSASPLLVGNHLYLLSEQGDCTILDITNGPRQIAKNSIGERCLASLAVVDRSLLLRSDKALYRIASSNP